MIQDNKLHSHECRCLTWRPIFAGALVALGLSFLLNLFSVAIGLTAYTADTQGVQTLAFGGLVAMGSGIIVSMFASGWIAGYLGSRSCSKRHLGALYGFLAWVVALIAGILLAENIQHYIVWYSHAISGTTEVVITAANSNPVEVHTAVSRAAQSDSVMISSYILFTLFFLSAFAASLGGHLGMEYVNKDERSST